MADNKISMPSGMGGLVRYSDDYKSKIMIKPEHVMLVIVLVLILEFLLYRMA